MPTDTRIRSVPISECAHVVRWLAALDVEYLPEPLERLWLAAVEPYAELVRRVREVN